MTRRVWRRYVFTFSSNQVAMLFSGDSVQYNVAVDAILAATEHLLSSLGNAREMVRQANEATSSLVDSIKLKAESETDPGE